MKKTVVVGMVGTKLDAGTHTDRWSKWRPTIALCQHDDLLIDRLILLGTAATTSLMKQLVQDVAQVSPETMVEPNTLHLNDPWDFEEVFGALHEVSRKLVFDTDKERYLVHLTTGTHVAQICMFLLTESRHLPASLLQSSPPKRGNGPGTFTIIDLDLSRYDRIAQRFQRERSARTSHLKAGIITRNPAFNQLMDQLERVTLASSAPILLLGPTGAGKSQLARRIYDLKTTSHQVTGPLVEVNCATLRGDQAMSALFGHIRGAFTGASKERSGFLRRAHQGVLFLDEIGELDFDEQAMLLHAIETGTFYAVGSDKPTQSTFQLLAGTNRDLVQQVKLGKFREDLLARIDLWTFRLPALRERPEDLEPNLEHELERVTTQLGRQISFQKEARTAFLRFATGPHGLWRGNFRDLASAVTRMAALADGGRITHEVVQQEQQRLRVSWGDPPPASDVSFPRCQQALGSDQAARLDLFDLAQLEMVLEVCTQTSTLSEAGRMLFGQSRQEKASTNDADPLRKYLQRFGLSWHLVKA